MPRVAVGLGLALVLCGAAVQLPAFLQLAPRTAPPAAPLLQPAPRALPTGVAATAEAAYPGATFLVSALLGAAAAIAGRKPIRQPRPGATLAGQGSELLLEEGLGCAQIGVTGSIESLVTMGQVKRRPHMRICERGWKEIRRQNRVNSGAKQRFLQRPDGTLWYIQPGLRHLKSKKSPARRKWLKRMYRVDYTMEKRIGQLLHFRPKRPTAADFIMRKFNEKRSQDHLATGDRVAAMLWTSTSWPK